MEDERGEERAGTGYNVMISDRERSEQQPTPSDRERSEHEQQPTPLDRERGEYERQPTPSDRERGEHEQQTTPSDTTMAIVLTIFSIKLLYKLNYVFS